MAKESAVASSKAELLWKVIGRYDTYIGATNTKAALLATFDTFVFSTVVLKWVEIVAGFPNHPYLANTVSACVAIAAIASAASIILSFVVMHPFLSSPKSPGQYHSNIFFGHVAEFETGEAYAVAVRTTTDDNQEMDLAKQAHALAKGLKKKMERLQAATIITIVSLVAIIGIVFCIFIRTVI